MHTLCWYHVWTECVHGVYHSHVTCYMLHTTYYYMLHVICYMLHATCYIQPTTLCMLYATCYMLHTTYYILHVTCYLIPDTCYTLHYIRSTIWVVPFSRPWRRRHHDLCYVASKYASPQVYRNRFYFTTSVFFVEVSAGNLWINVFQINIAKSCKYNEILDI